MKHDDYKVINKEMVQLLAKNDILIESLKEEIVRLKSNNIKIQSILDGKTADKRKVKVYEFPQLTEGK